jgi:hypothetical protein
MKMCGARVRDKRLELDEIESRTAALPLSDKAGLQEPALREGQGSPAGCDDVIEKPHID